MPSTISGLIIFWAFLTPGYLSYIQRQGRVPQRSLSPLVEVATFLSVSLATDLLALGAFSLIRLCLPTHTPNIRLLLSQGSKYIDPRIGYVAAWSIGILITSCTLAIVVGRWPPRLVKRMAPVIIDASAWYHIFEAVPSGCSVYVGCDLIDGTYVSGFLEWFNTDVDESEERDLVLGEPIIVRANGVQSTTDFQRMILSARNISRLSVSYLGLNENGSQPDESSPS